MPARHLRDFPTICIDASYAAAHLYLQPLSCASLTDNPSLDSQATQSILIFTACPSKPNLCVPDILKPELREIVFYLSFQRHQAPLNPPSFTPGDAKHHYCCCATSLNKRRATQTFKAGSFVTALFGPTGDTHETLSLRVSYQC